MNMSLTTWGLFRIHDWSQLFSLKFGSTAVGFVACEGLWDYSVFNNGLEIAGMDARNEARTFLYGDLKQAASLLYVDVGVLKAYCRSYPIPESLQGLYAYLTDRDWGENVRAFPGDEFDPWNEWAHCDFARHIGAEYPVVDRCIDVNLQVDSPGDPWPELPHRLDRAAHRVYPSRWLGLERLHPRNWP